MLSVNMAGFLAVYFILSTPHLDSHTCSSAEQKNRFGLRIITRQPG
jgi:hypothetical protein